MSTAPPSFGEWVRKQRRQLDLTQAALAAQLGCAVITIKKIEQGMRRPSLEMAQLLANHLQVPRAQHQVFLRMARGELVESIPPVGTEFFDNSQRTADTFPVADFAADPAAAAETAEELAHHFVARERELTQLAAHLNHAVNGSGRVVFVTGEAGSGKTSLMAEFARRAQDLYPDLIVANGNCDAFAGIGDPYLPFRDVMGLLTGDVESKWRAGLLALEQARRLWDQVPATVEALDEHGPDLIDLVVPGAALLQRAIARAPEQMTRWHALHAQFEGRRRHAANLAQRQIFAQYSEVLHQLAARRPLLIFLDDLQWTDSASAGMLFHLGRRLADSRILILGAYRPNEVSLGRNQAEASDNGEGGLQEHPLIPVVQEFKRRFGEIEIDLSWLGAHTGRVFIDALLDQEPNQLGEAFRAALYQRTEGHPLFTVEMLRDMQERGDLTRDARGRWVEGHTVNWDALPARVEAVIGRRLESLPDFLLEALKVASVEGETFTAEVVARVQGANQAQMVRHMSASLSRQHLLVRSQGSRRVGEHPISHYRFGHILFQKYLYDHLDSAERIYLHEAVGDVLETLYREDLDSIAGQLAHHYQVAGMAAKAITYLRMAGERAVRLSAHEEAITHFMRALALLETLPASTARDVQEFHLRIALGVSLVTTRGWPAPQTEVVYARTHELVSRLPDDLDMELELSGLYYTYTAVYFVRGQLPRSLAMSQECLELAQERNNPMLFMAAHAMLGPSLYHMGKLLQARTVTEQASRDYELHRSRSHVLVHGPDLGVFCWCYVGHICWPLGYADLAVEHGERALAIAQEQSHPFSVVVASCYLSMIYQFRREPQQVRAHADAALALCTQYEFVYYTGWATFMLGWARAETGDLDGGIAQMQEGLAALRALKTGLRSTYYLAVLAEAHAKNGQPDIGLALLDEAVAWMDEHEERYYEAELHRLRGELLLQAAALRGSDADAESERCFQTALAVARQQAAKTLELRALLSLARQAPGNTEPIRSALAELCAWFTEGLDTPDLQEAQAILAALNGNTAT